jgi:hypothetical protein
MSLIFSALALEKIHLNPKTVISAFIVGSIQVMFPEKNLQN